MSRIALFIPSFGGGGAENVFAILANHWVEQGKEVDYMVCSSSGPMRARLDPRVNVIEMSNRGGRMFRRFLYAREISKYCRQREPLFLLTTLTYCNLTAAMAKVFFGLGSTKLLIREANSLANIRKSGRLMAGVNFLMMRWLYPKVDWVTANSENTLNELERQIGTPAFRQVLIRNPVEMRTNTGCRGRKEKVILGCGRLLPQKDFATLVKAVAQVQQTHDCRLVIIGEGSERENLQTLADSLGMNGDLFTLPGFVDDPEPYYLSADVFVLPSKWEGLPNVVLEALSYDLPVVATDCSGGTREIFTTSPQDHLVNVGDVEAMAAKIIGFFECPPQSERMQSILSGRYDVGTIASSYCKLARTSEQETLNV